MTRLPKITIVTGNKGKVKELEIMSMGQLDFKMLNVDIPEIQSLDIGEIVRDKLRLAYEAAKSPVIVDDVSAEIDCLNGLPGPFVKFFNQQLGERALLILAGRENESVTLRCMVGFYDGKQYVLGEGAVKGRLVEPRGQNGFGFDFVVVPEGSEKTMAEMTPEEKTAISHRGRAFRDLMVKLEDNF